MTKVLVTGSSGYIGKHVVESLYRKGAEVISLDVFPSNNPYISKEITDDLLSPDFSLKNHLNEIPDVCLHLAWRNGFDHNNVSHMADLSGHYCFLKGLIDSGIKHIAVMGSMHEVGYWEGAIDENTPCSPQSLYGVAKDSLRRALSLEAQKTETVFQWMRGFYLYGDDMRSQNIFGKIVRASEEGKKTFPFTSGKNQYDFIEISQLANQIASVVLQDEINGVINCCTGVPRSLAEVVESFIKNNNLSIQLEYGAFPDRPYDSPGVWGDSSKIEKILSNTKVCTE